MFAIWAMTRHTRIQISSQRTLKTPPTSLAFSTLLLEYLYTLPKKIGEYRGRKGAQQRLHQTAVTRRAS